MDLTKIFPLFQPETGLTILAVYAAVVFALTYLFASGYSHTKDGFLVAKRELNTIQGAMSTGAAWMWAPGMFISAQQAYQNGLVGLFWFTIGNFLSLRRLSWSLILSPPGRSVRPGPLGNKVSPEKNLSPNCMHTLPAVWPGV